MERVLYAMTESGEVYAERWIDRFGEAWVAPLGTPEPAPDACPDLAWQKDVTPPR